MSRGIPLALSDSDPTMHPEVVGASCETRTSRVLPGKTLLEPIQSQSLRTFEVVRREESSHVPQRRLEAEMRSKNPQSIWMRLMFSRSVMQCGWYLAPQSCLAIAEGDGGDRFLQSAPPIARCPFYADFWHDREGLMKIPC